MRPAYPFIFFTTSSGMGCGLLVLLGLMGGFGVIAADRGFGATVFALALVAVIPGLRAAPLDVGPRERASRDLSQWRTSWRSRQAIAAFATCLPAGIFALGWVVFGRNGGPWALAGIASAVGGLLTMGCTAMTYAGVSTVPAWSNRWTVPAYLALDLATGSLWLSALSRLFSIDRPAITHLPIALVLAAWIVKALYWARLDRSVADRWLETGAGAGAETRMAHPAVTARARETFVLGHMSFAIARRHAYRLRRTAQIFGFLLPLALTELVMFLPEGSPAFDIAATFAGALLGTAGVLVERWLFFAEARHVLASDDAAESNSANRN